MEKGDTSADAAVFAMILLLVNSQDNIISSRTNQISISAEIMVVGSASKVISLILTSSSKNLHVTQKYSPMHTCAT
jgi:hypothetical protein